MSPNIRPACEDVRQEARVVHIVSVRPIATRAPVPGAEKTLPTTLVILSSGNYCEVTPAGRPAGNEMRIAIQYDWHREPTTEEDTLVEGMVESNLGLTAKVNVAQGADRKANDAAARDWLTDGRLPAAETAPKV